MKDKFILAYFNDEEPVLSTVSHLNTTGTKIWEVYSPFPIHGIDDLLGYKRTRLSIAAFLFGSLGFTCGLGMQSYMLGFSKWRINIGGKNYLAWPDFVPVTFELTVLITALGMVACFFLACRFFPGAPVYQPHPRITDDLFCIAIKESDVSSKVDNINSLLKEHGAIEVSHEEIELKSQKI